MRVSINFLELDRHEQLLDEEYKCIINLKRQLELQLLPSNTNVLFGVTDIQNCLDSLQVLELNIKFRKKYLRNISDDFKHAIKDINEMIEDSKSLLKYN